MPKRTDIKRILVIGSGPIVIGQACEFDYSGTQACKVLKEDGYDMNIVRGVIGSLVKKERIFFSEDYMGNIILRRYIYINHEVEM